MAIIAKDKGEIELIPADTQHGVCYSIIDIGTQPSNNPQFRPKRQVIFTWELPQVRGTFERNGKMENLPRAISRTMTLSLSPKSNMLPMLVSWRGRAFTAEELDGFDITKILGANALLTIVHEKKTTGTYANVASVSKLMKGMTPLKPENPLVTFSIDDVKGKFSMPPNIPDWIKAKIMQSQEWQERMGDQGHQPDAQGGYGEEPGSGEAPVDDVPF